MKLSSKIRVWLQSPPPKMLKVSEHGKVVLIPKDTPDSLINTLSKNPRQVFKKRNSSSYDFRGHNPIYPCVSAACLATVLISPHATALDSVCLLSVSVRFLFKIQFSEAFQLSQKLCAKPDPEI